MPTKPLPQLLHRSSAESASHALRAALAERLAGRMGPQGDVRGATRLAMEALAALPGAAPRKLHGAA